MGSIPIKSAKLYQKTEYLVKSTAELLRYVTSVEIYLHYAHLVLRCKKTSMTNELMGIKDKMEMT